MSAWISQHTDLLSLAADIGMLAVWFIYLNVFLSGYRRQVRPKIVINRGGGSGMDARCFISNMSSEAIYIEDIRIRIDAGDQVWNASVIDVDGITPDAASADPKLLTHQGTLKAGEYIAVGRYDEMIDRVLETGGTGGLDALVGQRKEITARVMVIADHSADDLLIAAWRRFVIKPDEKGWLVCPSSVDTEQIRSRSERRRIERELASELAQS